MRHHLTILLGGFGTSSTLEVPIPSGKGEGREGCKEREKSAVFKVNIGYEVSFCHLHAEDGQRTIFREDIHLGVPWNTYDMPAIFFAEHSTALSPIILPSTL